MADPLSIAASIVAILQLSAKILAYLNDVKDASKDRAQCAVEASNIHSLLTNLRFRLEASTGTEPRYTAIRALAVENGPFDQFKAALLKLRDGMTEGGRLKMAGAALRLPFRWITYIPLIQSKLDTVQLNQENEERLKVLAWLSSSNYPAQQSDVISRKQEGTGEWFTSSPKFTAWLHEPGATLFCPGIPGAGKTVIAATAIEHLKKTTRNNTDAVAYLFLNYKEQENQNVVELLGSIVKQFLQGQALIADHVLELYRQQSGTVKPSSKELTDALQAIVLELGTAYLVVDALDECCYSNHTRRQLLAHIRLIQQHADLRLMATSRPLPDIVAEFPTAPTLEVRAHSDDVKQYVTGQLSRLPRCIQRDVALQDQVRDEITEAIDGMFLLARLHVDSLLDKKTKKAVLTTLTRLSKSQAALKDAYSDAIERIDSQLILDSALAKRALSWITLARRPLRVSELLYAFAVEPGTTELDSDNMLDIEDVISVCAGLITVEEESGIVRLVHYTTQDFLENTLKTWNPKAQVEITTTCLARLSHDSLRPVLVSKRELQGRLASSEFLQYAACHWGDHARLVQADICEEACAFLFDAPLVLCAAQIMLGEDNSRLFRRFGGLVGLTSICLHVTAQFGLYELMRMIITKVKDDVNATTHATPIWLALNNKDIPSTRTLIGLGVESRQTKNPARYDYQRHASDEYSPLHLASECGHIEAVELLLDLGVGIDTLDRAGKTALHVASLFGYAPIVELLIEKGAKVGTKLEPLPNGGPLQVAAGCGHVQVVSMLLRAGADVDPNTPDSPLITAAEHGDQEIVTMLLNAGANIDAHVCGYSALGQVSFNGGKSMIKLLLDSGANCNVGPAYWRPLEMAISRGRSSIIELLVARGADTGGGTLEMILSKAVKSRSRWHR